MKATIGILSGLLVAASVAACAENPQPAREPLATETTYAPGASHTTYAYDNSTMKSPRPTSASSTNGSMATSTASMGAGSGDNSGSAVVHPDPMNAPVDPSLQSEGASPRPVAGATEPGPVNAKATDKKAVNGSAMAEQGNGKSEVKTSAAIRRRVMASKTLSFGAKNAKIITAGTKVTLKGDVKTDAEKTELAGIARNTDGVTEVDDQLVVKP